MVAVIPGSSLASTVSCVWPPNGSKQSQLDNGRIFNVLAKAISFVFLLSICSVTHMHTDYTLAVFARCGRESNF